MHGDQCVMSASCGWKPHRAVLIGLGVGQDLCLIAHKRTTSGQSGAHSLPAQVAHEVSSSD